MAVAKVSFPKLHDGQKNIYHNRSKRDVIRCGRRYGKTTLFEVMAGNFAINKKYVGFFSPTYKLMIPSYNRIARIVRPIIERSSKIDGIIELKTGGHIEFWTLNDENAGRSRYYDEVIIDEASLVKKGMKEIWEEAIAPTLLDRNGNATMAGTPKGIDDENYFYLACTDKKLGWQEFHAPTSANPMLNAESVANLIHTTAPLVYQQEFLAEFVDWSGAAFFSLQSLLVDGQPCLWPQNVDAVYAVIDSATKTGKEHDGTAVAYFARSAYHGTPLVVLDYDIVQIEGALLETWLPTVFQRLEDLAVSTKARMGVAGVHIEDKASGMILIQQAQRRGWDAHPIDSELTSVGKEERAISVSGYVYRGMVKLAKAAFDKVVNYKGITRNHFLTQVLGFRIGEKDQADDLTDCFTYGIALGLGNDEGF
jgi:hypothetical protein